MNTKTITVGEAIKSLNFLATNFMETKELDKEALEVSRRAISKNLLVRDYFMGMPNDFGLTFMISLCKKMIEEVSYSELLNLYAVYSAFLYENGEKELSINNLNKALEIDSEHSLVKLLVRVYGHECWKSSDFVEMRNEIHSKVIVRTKENAEVEI